MNNWFFSPEGPLAPVVLSTVCIYLALIAYTRLFGLRSFSKMSAFDMIMTVAVGSTMASTIVTRGVRVAEGLTALLCLFLLQFIFAQLRRWSGRVRQVVDNQPLLLMEGNRVLHENLAKARLTEDDLRGKLRAAHVVHRAQVRAVVFETTGDVSVMFTEDNRDLEPWLLEGVRRG